MNILSLLLCFALLLILAISLLLYPLRQSKQWLFLFAAFIGVGISLSYQYWGGWQIWREVIQKHTQHKQIQHVLKSPSGTESLVKNMQERLKDRPNSAQGWYLLGRVYASQGKWVLAREAYQKAYELKSEDETIAANYFQSLWEINQQQCSEEIRILFKGLLQKNPNQGDSLAILALDAFQHAEYSAALNYWQRLLQLLPNDSEETEVITQAISETKKRLEKF